MPDPSADALGSAATAGAAFWTKEGANNAGSALFHETRPVPVRTTMQVSKVAPIIRPELIFKALAQGIAVASLYVTVVTLEEPPAVTAVPI